MGPWCTRSDCLIQTETYNSFADFLHKRPVLSGEINDVYLQGIVIIWYYIITYILPVHYVIIIYKTMYIMPVNNRWRTYFDTVENYSF